MYQFISYSGSCKIFNSSPQLHFSRLHLAHAPEVVEWGRGTETNCSESDSHAAGGPGRLEVFLDSCKLQSDPIILILITGGEAVFPMRVLWQGWGLRKVCKWVLAYMQLAYFMMSLLWRQHLELASFNFEY